MKRLSFAAAALVVALAVFASATPVHAGGTVVRVSNFGHGHNSGFGHGYNYGGFGFAAPNVIQTFSYGYTPPIVLVPQQGIVPLGVGNYGAGGCGSSAGYGAGYGAGAPCQGTFGLFQGSGYGLGTTGYGGGYGVGIGNYGVGGYGFGSGVHVGRNVIVVNRGRVNNGIFGAGGTRVNVAPARTVTVRARR